MSTLAFFDLDGTLIRPVSLLSFYCFYYAKAAASHLPDPSTVMQQVSAMRSNKVRREAINAWFYRTCFAGSSVQKIKSLAHEWSAPLMEREDFYIEPVIQELRRHQGNGVECVLVTGSCSHIAEPITRQLGIRIILGAPLIEIDGKITGAMYSDPMIGQGKRHAVKRYAATKSICLTTCFGYGDDESDLPFLETLGKPVYVAKKGARPDFELTAEWRLLEWDESRPVALH